MALTLNGSNNTIGGVAVGGLPNGIVDADMLATDSVISAKIDDGAITAAKMASGVGGKILTSGGTATYSGTINSDSYVDVTSFNITPSSTSSKILIMANSQGVQEANTNTGSQVLRDSTQIDERSLWANTGSSRNVVVYCWLVLDSPNTTSQITYKIQMKRTNSGGVGTGPFGYNGKVIYFEVAG